MSEDNGDMWRSYKAERQEKRADNRELSAKYLADRGILFQVSNGGAHLIVEGKTSYIDFWPGTGRWIERKGISGFGVKNLVEHILK